MHVTVQWNCAVLHQTNWTHGHMVSAAWLQGYNVSGGFGPANKISDLNQLWVVLSVYLFLIMTLVERYGDYVNMGIKQLQIVVLSL